MGDFRPLPAFYLDPTLSDEELQTVLVRQAEAKYRECVADREDWEAELRRLRDRLPELSTAAEWAELRDEAGAVGEALVEARRVEAGAAQFLADALAALEKYRTPPPPRKALRGRRRTLKRPGRGGG